MSRNVPNWIDAYVRLQENTEPAQIFDVWCAYSIISAALRRKVWLQLGRLTYHSNIYVVFVAEPGKARKTRAIDYGAKFLANIPEIVRSSDSATKEAMTDDIESSGLDALTPNGDTLRHCSLNIISREFESFLGQKKENTRMLTALTDLFDCPEDWTSRTRHGTSNKIIRPWLNLLSATTPESLANSLPSSAVGGGLTSRILFIWADKKKRPVTVPVLTQEEAHLKELMEKDLYVISRLSGEYTMSADCIKKWDEWYMNYDEDEDGSRICKDKSFSGWYSRKPTYIVKIAMIRAAAESDTLVVTWRHVEESIAAIQRVEEQMGNAFKAIGRSEISGDVDNCFQIIKQAGIISEKSLMSQIWKDVDNSKFDNVIETIIKTGKVQRLYKGPNDEKGIHYIYIGG